MSRNRHNTTRGITSGLIAGGAAAALGMGGAVACSNLGTNDNQYPDLGMIHQLDEGIGVTGCIELPPDSFGERVWTHPISLQTGMPDGDTAIVYPERSMTFPDQPAITSADLAAARDGRDGMSLYPNTGPISVAGADVVCSVQVPGGAELTLVGTDGRVQNLKMDAMHAGALAGMVAVVQVNPDGSVARLDLQPTPGMSDPTIGA